MCYDDHVAAGCGLCLLADAAVMLYEQEYKSKHNHSTNLSAKEEDKTFFYNFPRKTRSSLTRFVTRRKYPQKIHTNLNESSSLLRQRPLDLNSFPAAEFETTEEPLEGPPFLTSAESEVTNPPNPNSQKKTRSKRRAEQESKRKAKKAKVVAPLSWKGREMPERLVQLMKDMSGTDPMLIFEKTLNETDVNRYQSRLLMPFKTLIRNDFLTPVELSIVEEDDDENNDENFGVGSILVDQQNVKWGVNFRRRDMKKKGSGKVSMNYALITGWSDMVDANGLKKDDSISVWSFRCRQVLCFAIVSSPTD